MERAKGPKEYAKIGFGLVILVILVAGAFRPAFLSGIPILFAVVTFLGGMNIFAGVTALLLAIAANLVYIVYVFVDMLTDVEDVVREKLS